jgi:hypothetical protein
MPGYARPPVVVPSEIPFTPHGTMSATTIQGAIEELYSEKASASDLTTAENNLSQQVTLLESNLSEQISSVEGVALLGL